MVEEEKKPVEKNTVVSSGSGEHTHPHYDGENTEEEYSSYYNPFIQRALLGSYDEDTDWFYILRVL